ncbi:GrpB family protein [Mesobacillus boroniphilus]|uniref:GrpB family protein n=1 Tax=Mesobacillus boroniphilus TaxID=308892 RepID=A0A944CKI9_9BACI|nr:GrpB family protein [Mesobacillus boroniphilus]MBS8264776.1 GrpB family protein [Mesobacillus boroniphilus]
MTRRRVEVVPYNPEWKTLFENEKQLLETILEPAEVEIHHIGSTSVPGLSAKPIIDIMLAADSLAQVEKATPAIEAAGYEAKGENGIPGRRYFQKYDENGIRKVHLHSFEKGSHQLYRHLVFRDYLRAHPREASKYAVVKEIAAQKFEYDIESYIDGKSPIVKEIEQKAMLWRPIR